MVLIRRLASAILVLVAFTLLVDSTSAAAFKRVHKGESAPTFTLPDLDGKPYDLAARKDAPLTILVFWALWSPNSAPLLTEVQKLIDEFGAKGLGAVAVNVEGANAPADLPSKIQAFAQEKKLTYPVVIDKALDQYNAWGVIAAPATAFLAKDLKVVYDFSGHPRSAYLDMREQVMKALGIEKDPAVAAAKPKRERYHPVDKKVTLNYGQARTLFERGQFSKALPKVKKVLEDDAKFPDAHALNGAIHLGLTREGKQDLAKQAREEFQKAVDLDPTVPLGLAGLAHFALADGDPAKALEFAEKALANTEPADLPKLAVGEPKEAAAAAEAPKAEEAGGKAEAPKEGDREAGLREALAAVAAALKEDKKDAAKGLLEPVVEGFLGLHLSPDVDKNKGAELMKGKQQ